MAEYLGVDYLGETPFAFCGKQKWQLIPGIITKKIVDAVNKHAAEYAEALENQAKGKLPDAKRYAIYEKATKEILELTLTKFSYAKYANHPECGPALLGELAGEVRDFTLAGGKHGMRRLKIRLDSMKQISSNISQN